MSFNITRPVDPKRGEGPLIPVPIGGMRAMRGDRSPERVTYVRLSDLYIKPPSTEGPPPGPNYK
jgi:hypothetical protein